MKTLYKILCVDDDVHSLENMNIGLRNDNYFIEKASDYNEAMQKLKGIKFDLLVTDLKMPYKDGLDLAKDAMDQGLIEDVILVTGFGDEESIERALKIGFKDFIRKPYDNIDLIRSVERIYKNAILKKENEELREKLKLENKVLKDHISKSEQKHSNIIGKSRGLEKALQKAKTLAKFSESCFIIGESGTGKELLAEFIHKNGPRADKPYIVVSCPEISPSLFESELFGYVKGAFTGASDNTPGLFELADGGILFLDEISEIPISLQVKLLRVIETGEVRRVGDNKWRKVDVQLIASSNRTHEELMDGKIIRKDLYHRLAASQIFLPPLRERQEDIVPIFEYYLQKFSNDFGKEIKMPEKDLLNKIRTAKWSGNVRQLKNFARHYILFGEIDNPDNFDKWMNNGKVDFPKDQGMTFKFVLGTMEELESAKYWLVEKILKKYNYNKSKTAQHLGMTYPGLHKLLKKMERNGNGNEEDK